jgi:hypothetical protein
MADSASLSRRNFLTTAAGAAGATLLPTNLLARVQDPVVNAIQKNGKPVAHRKFPGRPSRFP